MYLSYWVAVSTPKIGNGRNKSSDGILNPGNSEYKVGNIKEKSVSLSKMAQATFGPDPFEDEECLACNVFPICGGGCPLDRQKKKMGKNINYCSIYKTRLADMLPALYECYEQ